MDPAATVGGLAKIIEVVLKIKEAAETARQNKGDCDYVRSRVETLCNMVQQLGSNAEAMNTDVAQSVLKNTELVLDEALTLVTGCQEEERITLCILYDAGKLSRKLTKVDVRITSANTDVQTALLLYLASRPVSERRRLLPHSTPESQLPQEITKVAGEIKEATETIYVNKAYFMEFGRRVNGVGTLMSLLLTNYTELMNQERMRAALGKLLDTLNEAHTLVKSYRGIRIIRVFLWPDRELDKQLHRLLDLILSDINAVNLIVIQKVQSER